jgi:hypothetical protein
MPKNVAQRVAPLARCTKKVMWSLRSFTFWYGVLALLFVCLGTPVFCFLAALFGFCLGGGISIYFSNIFIDVDS